MAYGSITSTKDNTSTGNNNTDALIAKRSWKSNDVTFSFTNDFANDYEEESGYPDSTTHASSFSTLNDTQRAVMREWTKMYEDVSNLNLMELTGSGDRDATIRIAESDDPSTAYAYLPWNDSRNSVYDGDIWFNRTEVLDDPNTTKNEYQPVFDNPKIGNYEYITFGHELGHALGLEHGHEKNGIKNIAMNSDRDSMEFSIMTYRSYEGAPTDFYRNETWGYAQSLMIYDIAAIQRMYGADFSTNSGNTTYTFGTKSGEMSINGVGQGKPGNNSKKETNRIFRTIWDGNGIDTYDFSNYTTNLSIDLTPGSWSNLDANGNFQKANLGDGNYARGHVFNALQFNGDLRSLIENANGGSGNDLIQGNDAQNTLRGNDGNDTIKGGADNDTIDGGNGNDTIDGGKSHDYLNGDRGKDNISGGDGNDTIDGGKSHDYLNGGDGNDTIKGSNGNDTIDGGNNHDYLNGDNGKDNISSGNGNDTIDGGNGNDYLNGDRGKDNISGGNGNDTIDGGSDKDIVNGGAGSDTAYGGAGNDKVNGNGGHDLLYGGSGNDTIDGGSGNDTAHGDSGDDIVNGGAGNDVLLGFTSFDSVEVDRLTGGTGNDRFIVGDFHSNGYKNAGNSDYVLIEDFNDGDIIQLDDGIYSLGTSPIAGISGIGVYEDDDLLTVIKEVSSSNLSINPQGFTTHIEYV